MNTSAAVLPALLIVAFFVISGLMKSSTHHNTHRQPQFNQYGGPNDAKDGKFFY